MAQRRIAVITYTNGTEERLRLRPNVEMLFERTYKLGITTAFSGVEAASNLYRLGWEVKRGEGGTIPDLATWLDTVEVVDVELEDVFPTAAGAPAAGSPLSQSRPESAPAPAD